MDQREMAERALVAAAAAEQAGFAHTAQALVKIAAAAMGRFDIAYSNHPDYPTSTDGQPNVHALTHS
jgi:hypothetical protein